MPRLTTKLRFRCYSSIGVQGVGIGSKELESIFPESFRIIHEAIDIMHEEKVISYINPLFKRKRYEGDHWDSVISKYKELQLPRDADQHIGHILTNCTNMIDKEFDKKYNYLPVHAIDLAKDGFIGRVGLAP
jgi:hypothetical protein